MTAERQRFREELRLQAEERFANGEGSTAIARGLRVSARSVQRWRRVWAEGGPRALRSQGPASLPRLSEKQFAQVEAELAQGPAAHGWEDQRWRLKRVETVIGRWFHLTCTLQGVRKLLVRNGWTCQVPARRAFTPCPTVLVGVVDPPVVDAAHSASVPHTRTKSGSVSRRLFSRPGARSAGRPMTVLM